MACKKKGKKTSCYYARYFFVCLMTYEWEVYVLLYILHVCMYIFMCMGKNKIKGEICCLVKKVFGFVDRRAKGGQTLNELMHF